MGVVGRWIVGSGTLIAEASLHDPGEFALQSRRRRGNRLVELTDVYTHPFSRGQGWSRLAVSAALGYADKRGWDVCLRVCVYGTPGTPATKRSRAPEAALLRFYLSLGFVECGYTLEREMLRRWSGLE